MRQKQRVRIFLHLNDAVVPSCLDRSACFAAHAVRVNRFITRITGFAIIAATNGAFDRSENQAMDGVDEFWRQVRLPSNA